MDATEVKRLLSCADCVKDPEVACWRDPDAQCLQCGKKLCAHHILPHLRDAHQVSVEWRGFLKAVLDEAEEPKEEDQEPESRKETRECEG